MSEKYLAQIEKHLEKHLEELGLSASPEGRGKLLIYLLLLEKWNKVYNLTSVSNLDEMFVKHILDSIAVAPFVEGDRLLDVGTGGGLPGVVLAILFPEKQIDLLDSNSKKTRFLIQVKAELALKNINIIHKRVEEYQPNKLYNGIISRAFTSLADMLHLTEHLLTKDGNWWAMKSQKTPQELADLPNLVKIGKVFELSVPNLDAQRTLIKLKRAV